MRNCMINPYFSILLIRSYEEETPALQCNKNMIVFIALKRHNLTFSWQVHKSKQLDIFNFYNVNKNCDVIFPRLLCLTRCSLAREGWVGTRSLNRRREEGWVGTRSTLTNEMALLPGWVNYKQTRI